MRANIGRNFGCKILNPYWLIYAISWARQQYGYVGGLTTCGFLRGFQLTSSDTSN